MTTPLMGSESRVPTWKLCCTAFHKTDFRNQLGSLNIHRNNHAGICATQIAHYGETPPGHQFAVEQTTVITTLGRL